MIMPVNGFLFPDVIAAFSHPLNHRDDTGKEPFACVSDITLIAYGWVYR
jgi:hypothetical protein